ncbi:MAG: LamG-like jellyroll fold domain-containing protein [Saprospiraceae bacterium]
MKSHYKSLILLFFIALLSNTTNAQNALSFDGINDYITVPNASGQIANQNMSLSLWVYPTNPAPNFPNLDGFAGIRNNSNADFYLIQISSTNVEARFRNSLGTNYDILFTNLTLNTWSHFVFTYDGSMLTLYVNGVSVGTQPATGTITSTTETLHIGTVPFNTTNFLLNGQLDDVCLWSKSLSANEVSVLYNACSIDLNSTNLELCYEFNQGIAGGNNTSITSVLDSKGNINGIFSGFALTGSTSNYVAYGTNASSTLNVSLCDVPSYTSPLGNTYTSSGTYQETIINGGVGGCDSIITINLALGNTTNNTTINPVTCSSYTSPSGQTYTTSGTYLDTINGFAGCDSIITINLTVAQTTMASIDVQTCDNYTSPSGTNTWGSSGTYTDIIPNAAGCDSIITINLTIGNNTGSTTISACESYTASNGTVYTSSGEINEIFTNAAGCDSILIINLVILPALDTTVSVNLFTLTANQNNATYQWVDCDNNQIIPNETNQSFTASADGNYAVIIDNGDCTDTSNCYLLEPVSTSTVFETTISTFPNPTSGIVQIDLGKSYDNLQLSINNVIGKTISSTIYNHQNRIELDLSDYAKGVYFINLQSDDKRVVLKIILE